VVFDGVKLQIR